MENLLAKLLSQIYMRFEELPKKLQRVIEEGGVKMGSMLKVADLLTWKSVEIKEEEENMVLEFVQQYEKLTDEEKSKLLETAKSAHSNYVQEMIKRVKETEEPKITFEISAKDSANKEVAEEDVKELLRVVKNVKETMKPKGSKMKMDTVSISLISSTS
jgi:uncharacterized protein YqgV (UPF0045/DUF77 family)